MLVVIDSSVIQPAGKHRVRIVRYKRQGGHKQLRCGVEILGGLAGYFIYGTIYISGQQDVDAELEVTSKT